MSLFFVLVQVIWSVQKVHIKKIYIYIYIYIVCLKLMLIQISNKD